MFTHRDITEGESGTTEDMWASKWGVHAHGGLIPDQACKDTYYVDVYICIHEGNPKPSRLNMIFNMVSELDNADMSNEFRHADNILSVMHDNVD